MTESNQSDATEKRTIGGSLVFRLPHAIVLALLGIAIAVWAAISNS